MKEKQPLISIVSPMYNEETAIANTIETLVNYLDNLKIEYELIIVNDGSTDRSYEVAAEFEKAYSKLKVVSYEANKGRGYALRYGINKSKGKYVITTESDLNWGTSIIEKLYHSLINTGADIVIASPHMKGGKLENVPLKRAIISRWGNIVLRQAVKSKIHMITGMTRGYIGDQIRKLHLEEDGKEIHLEIIAKAELYGYTVKEIPATLKWPEKKKDKAKPKRKSKFKMWNLIKSHLLFATNEAPILLFGSIGGVFLIIGIILGLSLFWDFAIKGEIIGDRIVAILATLFFTLSGTIILLISFVAYQLRDLKKETTKIKQMLYEGIIENKHSKQE